MALVEAKRALKTLDVEIAVAKLIFAVERLESYLKTTESEGRVRR